MQFPLAKHSVGYWLLATGYWLLATGHWLLASGYWLPATTYRGILSRMPLSRRERARLAVFGLIAAALTFSLGRLVGVSLG